MTELDAIGPWLASRIDEWIEDPPEIAEPPEVRSAFVSFAEARGVLDAHPQWRTELRADLQMHTNNSDGELSTEAMAMAAASRGYEYVAITDHSQGLKVAGGMDENQLRAQGAEIERVNNELESRAVDFRVLRSLEMNLDPEGNGDMDPEALAGLDLVLGSFHSHLRVTEDQTERYRAALDNPHIDILAHPRGRKYNLRTGLRARWQDVFEKAAATGKALEINSFPDRQDLQGDLLGLAREAGVMLSIGTDAHNEAELRFIDIALAAAIKAGIPRERILNFWPAGAVVEWAASSR